LAAREIVFPSRKSLHFDLNSIFANQILVESKLKFNVKEKVDMKPVPGTPHPLGFSIKEGVANFSLYSSHAEKVTLLLFSSSNRPIKEFPMQRTQDTWHIGIIDLPLGLFYAFRCEGPKDLLYHSEATLIDPYAKIIHHQKAKAELPPLFDWQYDQAPQIPRQELIIYEMHVRGFTQHPSSQVKYPGTYLGIIEKIPYLKKLGVNAIELMPIFGFDPTFIKSLGSKKRVNYWGYNPLHFFAPMEWYAHSDPIFEFKTMVRELHKAKIEVILDVVYNHTGEEDDRSYYVHFRGIDNPVYYLTSKGGKYLNFTGCGNTLNTNHPVVQKLILDSLHYWVEEMHVDGFRFDLASIFTRDQSGHPTDHPPILEAIQTDPILRSVKLIAEAWDAAELYQLGYFAKRGKWSEWNGRYRDVMRRFIKGAKGKAGAFANALCGSENTYYSSHTPLSSINFITAHDGFTLRDLVTYEEKHNEANGEANLDGNNQNDSWNCGMEGPTEDLPILELRERQMRNFLLALFLSQGIPMLLMGDEYGHTRQGNNNPYVQDNEINWFLWNQANPKIFQFISSLITFRLQHKQLHRTRFLTDADVDWLTDWNSQLVVCVLKGDPPLFIAFNAGDSPVSIDLPKGLWRSVINTSEDWLFHAEGPSVSSIQLLSHSAFLAIQKHDS
jgi:isoamylase